MKSWLDWALSPLRSVYGWGILLAWFGCMECRSAPPVSAEPKRPNILFILADDFRADALGVLGNRDVKTPNLDRLAEQGMVFTRAYTMGSMIGAVCLPSRGMIQTGRSLFHLSMPLMRVSYSAYAGKKSGPSQSGEPVLLPRIMAGQGYATLHVGKGGNECRPAIEAYGRNIVYDDLDPQRRVGSSQRHADTVIEFLRGRSSEKPFFIYLAPPVPHDPRVAPKEFMDRYVPEGIALPPSYLPVHPFDNGEMTVRDEKLAPWPRTPEIVRRHLADYYACVSALDHHLGRIFDYLKSTGGWENTLVVFAGDNGLSLGDHGLMGKQNLYENGGMHVPLVVAGPGVRRGRSEALVYLLDLFPTFCALAGAPVPAVAEGRSLLPILRSGTGSVRDHLFTAYGTVQRAVRNDRWKLIRYPEVDKTQLFDMKADPHERTDLAGRPEMESKVKEMMALLGRAQKEWDDPAPLSVASPKSPAWTPPPSSLKQGKPTKAE